METKLESENRNIKSFNPSNTIAFIIAIEDYRFGEDKGISSVIYARNDAAKFKKLLREDFNIPEENITTWLDKDANKSALENELKYTISRLSKDERLIFYYAGHGFYQGGHNRLSCWDTHPSTLYETTVCLDEILLKPLELSNCTQSLLFLDCCAIEISSSIGGRDFISFLEPEKVDSFIRADRYNALFMSCSPGEKSFPNSSLKHGIWTYHLIEALKGNYKEAIVHEKYITDTSLRDFLSYIVPHYITNNTELKNTQHPYSKINASNEFLIRELNKPEIEEAIDNPALTFDFSKARFKKIGWMSVQNASGFKKGHFIPRTINPTSNSFIHIVFMDSINKDIEEVYTNTKNVFSLKSKEITVTVNNGLGIIDCFAFNYTLSVNQHPNEPGKALISRSLTIKIKRSELPENFDDIFPIPVTQLIIPITNEIDFGELVSRFENLADTDGGRLEESPITQKIEYMTSKGILIKVKIEHNTIVLTPNKSMKSLQFIDTSIEELKKISIQPITLLR